MGRKSLQFTLALFFVLTANVLMAQRTVTGVVKDAGNKEGLVGASVVVKGTTNGTVTNIDGGFSLNVPNGDQTLIVSFIGYLAQEITVKGGESNIGAIMLKGDAVGLAEVSVIADVAVDRKTPVAVSTIDPVVISEKLGTQEFPEILKSTPSVYATKQGGGFGDSRINIRGFESANVAVLINGIPVNDMEWGGIYWSNWAGLSDVTRSMQVQRGLGASKVAVPSVGGSVNIITNTTDAERGGAVSTRFGNNGYRKAGFSFSTGLNEQGWAVTLLGTQTKGDGYILGTEFEGYSYFLNISKRINNQHMLAFTGFGAQQWHNQRSSYDMQTIADWRNFKDGFRYNPTYGYGIGGERKASAKNYYHKPQMSLNHYWTISDLTSLTTSVYASFGTGGGASPRGNNRSALYGSSTYRTLDGYLDYAAIMQENAADPNGSQAIIASSNNNHQWYGVISSVKTQLMENLNFSGGVDVRYYIGEHNRNIVDLMGGQYFIDPDRVNVQHRSSDVAYVNEKLNIGDKISRDYDGHVLWSGAFGQVEYSNDILSAFVSGALSNTTYWRYDRMYAASGQEKSDQVNFTGYSIKGGANYNLTENHHVFVNGGYFSRAPFFSSVFLSKDVSNEINNDAVNEKVLSAEFGYGVRYGIISANLNLYNTLWLDKSLSGLADSRDPDKGSYNAQGVNAVHRGIEFDFVIKPIEKLDIKGMVSYGDWKWDNDVSAYVFNRDGQPVDNKGNIVASNSEDHNKVDLNIAGVHIGDAAQTTASLGVNYELLDGLKLGADFSYFDRLYAKYNQGTTDIKELDGVDTWEVPAYYYFDANLIYNFKISGLESTFSFNMNNVFDQEYIVDAVNGSSNDWDTATVFYGFGRTWSAGLKVKF